MHQFSSGLMAVNQLTTPTCTMASQHLARVEQLYINSSRLNNGRLSLVTEL